MTPAWAVILNLILVHGPQGQEIEINVNGITSIRKPRDDSSEHFGPGVKCLIYMTTSNYIATVETCDEVVKMIADLEKH